MEELKNYYDEPIKVFTTRCADEFERDFLNDLVMKYRKAIIRAVHLGSRYTEAVQTVLDMEWCMVYGSVYRDYVSHVTINREKGQISVSFVNKFIY